MSTGAIPVLHVCDKFGVAGSSIHGVYGWASRAFPSTTSDGDGSTPAS